jgi:hypothetical protein
MVTSSRTWRNTRGSGKKGCLFILLLLAVAVYYGIGIGGHYFRYLRLVDEMRTQARMATNIDNGTIQRRLIRRKASYPVTFELPFYVYVHTFNPEARAPL